MAHLTAGEIAAILEKIRILKIARDSGVLNVKHGETSTTFRSTKEIQTAIDLLNGELSETRRGRVRYVFQSGKGL